MLSMKRFETEIDLTLKLSIRDSLYYARLIGSSIDNNYLQEYSNILLKWFIEEKLVYFPNSKKVIDSWIITAGWYYIHDEIPITEIPSVQQLSLFEDSIVSSLEYKQELKMKLIENYSEIKTI